MFEKFLFSKSKWIRNTFFSRTYCLDFVSSLEENDKCYDVAIIGGGIIGTAIAREISKKSNSLKSVLIEKENDLGKHQSSHNSGVIHSGVYYRPDSLKARLSREGVDLILKHCDENKIPYKIVGKLIIATNSSKLNDLRTLHDRGVANNVEGLEMLWTKEKIKEIEPSCNGIQALWCPKVANIDWGIVTKSFAKDFVANGGLIFLNEEVDQILESDRTDYPILITTKKSIILKSKYLIICGGLQSEVLSNLIDGGNRNNSFFSLRVDYQLLQCDSIKTNIYGVPDLQIPFLGVHITPRLDGGLLLGPNAVPAFKIEGYRNDEINLSYIKNTLSSAGFQNMTKRYFPQCFGEVKKALCPQFQIEELKSLANFNANDVQKGPTAVLGQLINNDGSFVDDFSIEFFEGCGIGTRIINCKFLPSPAATCSLVIADYVTERFLQRCQH